jgi:epidermal growth factor receptor substrate 15
MARQFLTTSGTGHPNLNLTSEEKRVYGQLFKAADPDGFEVVSGDVAVKFFEKTRLPPDVLGQVRLKGHCAAQGN